MIILKKFIISKFIYKYKILEAKKRKIFIKTILLIFIY